jgi:hypothetical protein
MASGGITLGGSARAYAVDPGVITAENLLLQAVVEFGGGAKEGRIIESVGPAWTDRLSHNPPSL